MTVRFSHQQLDVYNAALEFVVASDEIASSFPKGRSYLRDQLRRAAVSIPLNIAEGAGEFNAKEKARFYRIAKRSATECAAIIDVAERLNLCGSHQLETGRILLDRIVAMLTGLVRSGADADGDADAGLP